LSFGDRYWTKTFPSTEITLCGNDGDDAPRYLEKRVNEDLKKLKEIEE